MMMDRLCAAIAGNMFRHSYRASRKNPNHGLNEIAFYFQFLPLARAHFGWRLRLHGCFVVVFIYSFLFDTDRCDCDI